MSVPDQCTHKPDICRCMRSSRDRLGFLLFVGLARHNLMKAFSGIFLLLISQKYSCTVQCTVQKIIMYLKNDECFVLFIIAIACFGIYSMK